MIERQELHCHNCNKYVQFDLNMELDGNHVLTCPNCGHEHCRVVNKGKITGDRWDRWNQNNIYITNSGALRASLNLIPIDVFLPEAICKAALIAKEVAT